MKRALMLLAMPALVLPLGGAAAGGDDVSGQLWPAVFSAEAWTPVSAEQASASDEDSSDHSIVVTSDSRDFCSRLLRAIDSHEDEQIRTVRSLRYEGQRLCNEGHVRLGVARLREALIVLKGRKHP